MAAQFEWAERDIRGTIWHGLLIRPLHQPHGGPQMVRVYRQRFKPSAHLAAPQANFAITVLCADTPGDWARVQANRPRAISGTPEQVQARLTQLATDYTVDEIIAVTLTQDFADRVRSYELLAEVFELLRPDAIASKA